MYQKGSATLKFLNIVASLILNWNKMWNHQDPFKGWLADQAKQLRKEGLWSGSDQEPYYLQGERCRYRLSGGEWRWQHRCCVDVYKRVRIEVQVERSNSSERNLTCSRVLRPQAKVQRSGSLAQEVASRKSVSPCVVEAEHLNPDEDLRRNLEITVWWRFPFIHQNFRGCVETREAPQTQVWSLNCPPQGCHCWES